MPPRHLRTALPAGRVRAAIGPALAIAAVTASILLNQPSSQAAREPGSATVLDAAAGARPAAPASKAPVVAQPKPPSAKMLGFDFQLQTTYYNCAPAATHMVLSARGANVSQDQLAGQLGTTVNGTNSAVDTTRVLNRVLNTSFYKTHSIPGQSASAAEAGQLRSDVVHAISNGYAVVANIAGGATDRAGVWHDFPGGHYVAIVGYKDDGQSVKFADSSGMFGAGTYWMSTANAANWIATHGYSA
jgi:hypothetical protein